MFDAKKKRCRKYPHITVAADDHEFVPVVGAGDQTCARLHALVGDVFSLLLESPSRQAIQFNSEPLQPHSSGVTSSLLSPSAPLFLTLLSPSRRRASQKGANNNKNEKCSGKWEGWKEAKNATCEPSQPHKHTHTLSLSLSFCAALILHLAHLPLLVQFIMPRILF